MERYQELRESAVKTIRNADHLLTMTYPMVNDNKLLYNIAQNIFIAMDQAMTSVLEYGRLFKTIPQYPEEFNQKLMLFKDKIAIKHKTNPEFMKIMIDLKTINDAHKESTMEFSRKDKYVIASNSYELRTLSEKYLKEMISKAKVFIEQMHRLTEQNDRIFK